MNIALVDTKELRKTNLLMQVWKDGMRSRENPMTMTSLLDAIPPDIKKYCAWGTVGDAYGSAGIQNLGREFEARLKTNGDSGKENRQFAGVVVGMMTELGNELRFDNKPADNFGAFRAQSGSSVKYRVAAVPTEVPGQGPCGWVAVGDWSAE